MVDHRPEYVIRVNRATTYIANHLDGPLTLDELARVAAFSPYHFHRIFRAMVGETIGDFVARLRLEKAANLLLSQPTTRVIDVALACGFTSPASFSRAFRRRFGASASKYRAAGTRNLGIVDGKPSQEPVPASGENVSGTPGWRATGDPVSSERRRELNVKVERLPAHHVAYVRRLGYSKGVYQEHLNQAFQAVCRWAAARELFAESTLVIGVPYDNPDITPNDRCRYDACVTVPPEVTSGTGEVDVQSLPGGLYASLNIAVDDPAEIGRLVDDLYRLWLPASGYQADDRPSLEVYHDGSRAGDGHKIVLDYCLPIRPL